MSVSKSVDPIPLPQAAKMIGLSHRWIQRLAREGKFPAFRRPGGRFWFVKRADLEEFIKPQRAAK